MGRKGQRDGGRWAGAGRGGARGYGWVGTSRDRWTKPDGTGPGSGGPTSSLTRFSPPSPNRFWFRLYWFPLKVLYATCHCSLRSVPDIPFYFFFNTLLLLLTLMNLYWFLVSLPPTAPCPPASSASSPILVPIPGQRSRCRPFSDVPRC